MEETNSLILMTQLTNKGGEKFSNNGYNVYTLLDSYLYVLINKNQFIFVRFKIICVPKLKAIVSSLFRKSS